MAKKIMGGFDILIGLAGKFVEKQKGIWDHTAWLEFLSEVQKKGFEISDSAKDYLGSVLDSMKMVYGATTATKGLENIVSDMSEHTVNFIIEKNGAWDYTGWEEFVKDFQKKGFDLTDEIRAYLVGVLDAVRELYSALPSAIGKELSRETSKKEIKETKTAK